MIKANELRIGNWVSHENKNGKFNFTIKELLSKGINIEYNNGCWLIFYEEVNPIPLTPEILKKMGFKIIPKDRLAVYKLEGLSLMPSGDYDDGRFHAVGCSLDNTKVLYIFSLHQLQNLYFALTGEELQINLTISSIHNS